MIRKAAFVLALGFGIVGCQQKTEPAPVASAAVAPPPVAPVADIPTSEDYEQKALNEINPTNMEQELDKLEKEIAAK